MSNIIIPVLVGKRIVDAELVKRNARSVIVRLADGHIIKRKSRHLK